MSRRKMLGVIGGAAGFGSLLQPAVAETIAKKQKQVCLIWLDGGISQYESWHPLPDSQFAGPFRSIKTSVPGVHFSELMPHTAKIAHKISVVRTMATQDPNHSTGVPRMQRGDPLDRGVDYPYLGSAIAKLLGPADPGLPPYIWIKPGNGGFIHREAGFLGAKYGALALGDGRAPIHIHRPASITADADAARQALREKANERFKAYHGAAEIDAYETSYDMAQQLMARKDIFDDSGLDPRDRERYGQHPLGRHILRARGLLEAGVRFVKVNSYHWDTHGDNFNMSQRLVPQIDQPFAALVDDLDERGMLDDVLVIVMSEFGRSPVINSRLGRDHWPDCWSLALAGCGIKRGAVIGNTTADGAFVDDEGYDIGDLFHTIFTLLGINPRKAKYRHQGQKLAIANGECRAIKELML
ncbi:MAG: hypothetical protein ACI9UA_005630 [Pseudoalteromonas tetraodonis]|jgi:hypothetical protein